MKVSELIKILSGCDPEAKVILAKDGEGNCFSPLAYYDDQYRYEADTTWSGELVEDPWISESDNADAGRWNAALPCVVLWPVN